MIVQHVKFHDITGSGNIRTGNLCLVRGHTFLAPDDLKIKCAGCRKKTAKTGDTVTVLLGSAKTNWNGN